MGYRVGTVAKVYVASQAAISAHVYDGTLSVAADSSNVVQWTYTHPDIPIGTQTYGPDTPDTVYPFWCASVLHGDSTGRTSAVGTLVNFYNENDWALAAPRWQFNQITKPDGTNLLNDQPYTYFYDNVLQSFTKTYFYTNVGSSLSLGTSANPQDRYEIMAFAAESYVKALGATPNVSHGITSAVNLQSAAIWPTDSDHTAHKWHSAEFRSTMPRQRNYWKTLLSDQGFNLSATPLP
jgi:hypothetical protein